MISAWLAKWVPVYLGAAVVAGGLFTIGAGIYALWLIAAHQ